MCLTGFLMPGKPAVACLEGSVLQIRAFLKACRTELFATVPRAGRKMTLVMEESIQHRAFDAFTETRFMCDSGTHKRRDMASLVKLEQHLTEHGCAHAFKEIFNYCT